MYVIWAFVMFHVLLLKCMVKTVIALDNLSIIASMNWVYLFGLTITTWYHEPTFSEQYTRTGTIVPPYEHGSAGKDLCIDDHKGATLAADEKWRIRLQ